MSGVLRDDRNEQPPEGRLTLGMDVPPEEAVASHAYHFRDGRNAAANAGLYD
ncbi:MAG: hypothetical protein ACLS7Z_08765 [Christensenellales bacterium]